MQQTHNAEYVRSKDHNIHLQTHSIMHSLMTTRRRDGLSATDACKCDLHQWKAADFHAEKAGIQKRIEMHFLLAHLLKLFF